MIVYLLLRFVYHGVYTMEAVAASLAYHTGPDRLENESCITTKVFLSSCPTILLLSQFSALILAYCSSTPRIRELNFSLTSPCSTLIIAALMPSLELGALGYVTWA